MYARVDPEYSYLDQHSWFALKGKNEVYYAVSKIEGKNTFMHRLIKNYPRDKIIDHKDRDGLNNTLSNLRVCTNQQNQMNSSGRAKRLSRYKGLYKNKKGLWVATITLNGKRTYIKASKDELVAAEAYDNKAREVFGEFAFLNFPKAKHTTMV